VQGDLETRRNGTRSEKGLALFHPADQVLGHGQRWGNREGLRWQAQRRAEASAP
jgi:hypothetical protein